jgi:hypothetical protein
MCSMALSLFKIQVEQNVSDKTSFHQYGHSGKSRYLAFKIQLEQSVCDKTSFHQ